jgi:hypothetical protein
MKLKEEIIETNLIQIEFYNTKKKNFATKLWSSFREKTPRKIRKNIGILADSYALHKEWFFLLSLLSISGEKALEIGKNWLRFDWEMSQTSLSALFSCIHVTVNEKKIIFNFKYEN